MRRDRARVSRHRGRVGGGGPRTLLLDPSRRLVIALERGQLLGDAELGAVLPVLWARDREWAESTLVRPVLGRSSPEGQERTDLLAALLIAGEQRLSSALVLEAVRAMEADDHPSVFHDHSVCALGRQWGWRAPIGRVVARCVIRRLGAEPRVDVIRFYGGQGELAILPPASSSSRDVIDLPVGCSALVVLERVGAPDWITREPGKGGKGRPWTPGCELWEYDGEGASTRIVWSPPTPRQPEIPQTLMRIERIEAQQDAPARLRGLDFATPATARPRFSAG